MGVFYRVVVLGYRDAEVWRDHGVSGSGECGIANVGDEDFPGESSR